MNNISEESKTMPFCESEDADGPLSCGCDDTVLCRTKAPWDDAWIAAFWCADCLRVALQNGYRVADDETNRIEAQRDCALHTGHEFDIEGSEDHCIHCGAVRK